MLLLPISSKPPFEGQTAIEIPRLELQRANLAKYGRGWITVSECNYDILEKSYHFDPGQKTIGKFSDPFLEVLREKFAPLQVRISPHQQDVTSSPEGGIP